MSEFPRKIRVRKKPTGCWRLFMAVAVDDKGAWCVNEWYEDDFMEGNHTMISPYPDWEEVDATPTTRPMTNADVLEKVTTTPGMVVRYSDDEEPGWCPAQFFRYERGGENMEWAIVKDGVFSEPQKFEMTE